MGFGYSYETIEVDSYKDLPTPSRQGKPNARYVIRNRDGTIHRERFTGKDGNPQKMSIGVAQGKRGMDSAIRMIITGMVLIVVTQYHILKVKGVKNDLH